MLCLSIPTPGFPNFYYILVSNLESYFQEEISVMGKKRMLASAINETICCVWHNQRSQTFSGIMKKG